MSEIEQTASEAAAQQNPEDMTDEQLQALIDFDGETAPSTPEEPEGDETHEEAAVYPDDDEQEEEAEAAPEDSEDEATEKAASEDDDVDPELAYRDAVIEELRARNENIKATMAVHTGRLGALQNEYNQLLAQQASAQSRPAASDGDSDYGDEPTPVARPAQDLRRASAPNEDPERATAINRAVERFAATYSDVIEKGEDGEQTLSPEMLARLKKSRVDPGVLASVSAFQAGEMVEAMLVQARAGLLVDRAREARKQAEARRSATSEDLKKRKRASSMPAVGTQARPATKRAPKTPQDMTDAELKRFLDSVGQ